MSGLEPFEKKDEALKRMNLLLENQIQHLHETQAQLVEIEKINALSRLVVGIAHEINTPLGNGISMTSYVHHILKDLKRLSVSTEQSEIIEDLNHANSMVLDSLQKTARIINDFKSVADYQYDTNSREVDLGSEIKRISTIISQHSDFKCSVEFDITDEVKFHLAPNSLFQILQATLDNACIHAYPNQNGVIYIALKRLMLHNQRWIQIDIQDTGIGIPQNQVENIFEPFFTTMRGSDRIGLGLFSVHNIVTHVLSGTVDVLSIQGEGTTFTISFPEAD